METSPSISGIRMPWRNRLFGCVSVYWKLLFLAAFPFSAQASEDSSSTTVNLQAIVMEALRNNLNLKIQSYNPLIAEEDVQREAAAFDMTVFGSSSYALAEDDSPIRNSASRSASSSDNRSYSAGVEKKITSGAEITASTSVTRSDGTKFNQELDSVVGSGENEVARFSLSVTQPLLQGFGSTVNKAPVNKAQSAHREAQLTYRDTVFDLLQETEEAYWGLSEAKAKRLLSKSNLDYSTKLLEETRERESIGLATRLDVLEAEATVARYRQEILEADQLASDAADALLSLIGGLNDALDLHEQMEVQRTPPETTSLPEFGQFWRNTLARNPEIPIQEEVIAQREYDRILARNDLRPQLDLRLAAGTKGISDEDSLDAYDRAASGDGHDWSVGLSLNVPFGRRAARAEIRKAEYRINQEEIRLAEVKQSLLRSARTAWRGLKSRQEAVVAAKAEVRLREETLIQERSQFEEGLSTLRDLLEVQRDLDSARTVLLEAEYDAVLAEIELSRLEGTLLERYSLQWDTLTPPNSGS